MIDYAAKFDQNKIGIATHARKHPDRPALIMNDTVITYKAFDNRTNALANGLLGLGIEPGDRISILMHNSPHILETWAAVGKIAATPIALNYNFKEEEFFEIEDAARAVPEVRFATGT